MSRKAKGTQPSIQPQTKKEGAQSPKKITASKSDFKEIFLSKCSLDNIPSSNQHSTVQKEFRLWLERKKESDEK